MSDTQNTPAAEPTADPAASQGTAAASPEAAPAPPWGDPANFDADKAWNLIQNLRADNEKFKSRPALTDEQKAKLSEYDRLAEASKSELEKAQEAAQTNAQRAQALLDRTIKAEIKALASQGFADPEDASAFLDLSKYANGDGDVDSDAIKADLADLLQRKPHLGKSPESRVPAPNPAQGSSGSGPSGASQITDPSQLDSMSPEEIMQARKDGRLNRLMGIS